MKNLTIKLATLAALSAAIFCTTGVGPMIAYLGLMLCVEVSFRVLHSLA
jgi:hypothetical protein